MRGKRPARLQDGITRAGGPLGRWLCGFGPICRQTCERRQRVERFVCTATGTEKHLLTHESGNLCLLRRATITTTTPLRFPRNRNLQDSVKAISMGGGGYVCCVVSKMAKTPGVSRVPIFPMHRGTATRQWQTCSLRSRQHATLEVMSVFLYHIRRKITHPLDRFSELKHITVRRRVPVPILIQSRRWNYLVESCTKMYCSVLESTR